MKHLIYLFLLFFIGCQKTETILSTPKPSEIKIGSQIWSSQNLDVVTYRNGDTIPQVTDPIQWSQLTTGAWCYYNNDPELGKIYGKLYNTYAINDIRGLAPQGWKIPSVSDWDILSNYLGGDSVSGCKLKEKGTEHWLEENQFGSDDFSFTALPSGYRTNQGSFVKLGYETYLTTNEIFYSNCGNGQRTGVIKGDPIAQNIPSWQRFKKEFIRELKVPFTYGISVRLVKE